MSKHRNVRPAQKKEPKVYAPKVDLDIVIPVLNQFDYLDKCLKALPEACGSLAYHIYIVDNNSKQEDVDKFYPKLDWHYYTLFRFSQNAGFPMACNFGEKQGKSPYVLFLNSDCFMNPGSIEIMYRKFFNQPLPALDEQTIGIVGPKLIFPMSETVDKTRPAGKIQHAGLSFDIQGKCNHIFVGWDADHPKANIPCTVPAVTGACLMISRSLFDQQGGFFEGYGVGTWEDVDLCSAVRAAGKTIWYEPTAVGYHVTGGTATREKVAFDLDRNRYTFVSRWKNMMYWSDPERY